MSLFFLRRPLLFLSTSQTNRCQSFFLNDNRPHSLKTFQHHLQPIAFSTFMLNAPDPKPASLLACPLFPGFELLDWKDAWAVGPAISCRMF